jgi:hypothetical protein
MKTIIAIVVSMALLLSAPFAMARGGATRANLDRIWKKEQAYQQRIDRNLDGMLKGGQRGLPQIYDASGKCTGTPDSARFKP